MADMADEWMASMADGEVPLMQRLFTEHRGALQSFFNRRIRNCSDAADLAQEVYARMLRVRDVDSIHSPEAYLYTVAGNLVREYGQRHNATVELQEGTAGADGTGPTSADGYDAQLRVARLRQVLVQLPPKCRAVVYMQYHHEMNHQEIAARLQISTHMVKKYLARALSHCRRRMARLG
jgi:RNA polymerase sigma-70 factor (ECF subfamily)